MLLTTCMTSFDQDLTPILKSPGRWESRGDSSSSPGAPVLSGRIRPGWSCRRIPEWPRDAWSSSSLPQQLGNWHKNQELQGGHFWTSSIWQMASLHVGPQPVISRGGFLPVFHIQFQLSAFNFTDDWRFGVLVGFVFFFFFFFLIVNRKWTEPQEAAKEVQSWANSLPQTLQSTNTATPLPVSA